MLIMGSLQGRGSVFLKYCILNFVWFPSYSLLFRSKTGSKISSWTLRHRERRENGFKKKERRRRRRGKKTGKRNSREGRETLLDSTFQKQGKGWNLPEVCRAVTSAPAILTSHLGRALLVFFFSSCGSVFTSKLALSPVQ